MILNTLLYIFLAPVFVGTALAFGDGLADLKLGIILGLISLGLYLIYRFLLVRKLSYQCRLLLHPLLHF